jgi:uncharacterized integral membrane protein (TIGR00698 family)
VLRFASRTVLQTAIVVLGASLSLGRVARVGSDSIPLMLTTLGIALVAAWLIGRMLRVESRLRTLIGVGTAICGASAIAATSGVIAATEGEIAYAISTIFAFNVIAVLAYPALGHMLGLDQHAFGLWAGTAINDTSSVVASAYTYGHTAGSVAVVTKLARTTMIIPIVVTLAFVTARNRNGNRRISARQTFPVFICGFVVASGLNTAKLLPIQLVTHATEIATYLITVALAAIGLSTPFESIRRTGARPLLLGAALWITVGATSLGLEHFA